MQQMWKIYRYICTSFSAHCAGYGTLWNLEFTAEGDSTKGKVWQHHQLAPEHTQLKPLQMCLTAEKHQTSQELRMLSSVTLNCQVTKIVMDSVSQL